MADGDSLYCTYTDTKQFMIRIRSGKTVLLVLFIGLFSVTEAISQPSKSIQADSIHSKNSESAQHVEPYESNRSILAHTLALPSYLLNWSTRPFGWSVKWAEINLPRLLQGERAPYGIFPLFELGGDVGAAYGALIYHNQFTKYNHKIRLEALFGSEEYNDFDFSYTLPTFYSERNQLRIEGEYSNDPVTSLFGGNRSKLDDEELFATERLETAINFGRLVSENVSFSFESRYRQIDISTNETILSDPLPVVSDSLRGTTTLFSVGGELKIDAARESPRILRGSRYILGFEWNRSLTDDRFEYLRYDLEWHQFLPLPLLPDTRRLAIKTRLQKAEAISGKEVPFFDYPRLGSAIDLRGFRTDRFRDDGSLLVTVEYRYPLWDFADMVLFLDEGQVFNRFEDIALDNFKTGYGFGFHLISTSGFAFRSEFAFSRESSRVILSINPNF